MSFDGRGGRLSSPLDALKAARHVARRALALVAADTEETYLANDERQLAIERLLLRFGEALKAVPQDRLEAIDPEMDWSGPKRFRDLAAHWYTDGLDHRLIWRTLQRDLPRCAAVIETHLAAHRE